MRHNIREGDAYEVCLEKDKCCTVKVVYLSKKFKGMCGLKIDHLSFPPAFYRPDQICIQYNPVYIDKSILTFSEDRLKKIGNFPLTNEENKICLYEECGAFYMKDDPHELSSDIQKDLIPTRTTCLGIEAMIFGLRELCGLETRHVLSDSTELLSSTSKLSRRYAAKRLGVLGSPSIIVLEQLIKSLSDEGRKVRRMATLAIAQTGIHPREVLSHLESMLLDVDQDVRIAAEWSINRLSNAINKN